MNFLEYTFVPTAEEPDHDAPDFRNTLRTYYPFALNYPAQVKAWRKDLRANLVQSGGHRVRFPGLLLYPQPFVLRHYPYLSAEHFKRKYLKRRYAGEELAKGWHTWRSRLREDLVKLPSKKDLNLYVPGESLSLANPRFEHVAEGWTEAGDAGPRETPEGPVQETPGGERGLARRALGRVADATRPARIRVGVARSKRDLGRRVRSGEVPPEVRESGVRILDSFSGARDLTFIRGRGNTGDLLIHAGTRELLGSVPYREVVVDVRDYRRRLGELRGDTALITGCGGWSGPFHALMPGVLELVERRFREVIVLPSTVDVSVEPVRRVLSGTRALFFARERVSYEQLEGLVERTDLAHDCAFFFDFAPYRRPGEGTLVSYRTDGETDPGRGAVPPGSRDLSLELTDLDAWLGTIAAHEVVETDRAHVMIAAAMLGKRVRYRSSNYHKVPAIAGYALGGFPVERVG